MVILFLFEFLKIGQVISQRTYRCILTGIRSLDRPARSESPYRLSYPGRAFANTWKFGSPDT